MNMDLPHTLDLNAPITVGGILEGAAVIAIALITTFAIGYWRLANLPRGNKNEN